MDLDRATFLTAWYVIVDDCSQTHRPPQMPATDGPPAQRSDRDVRCLALAAQWRRGVPWQSARGVRRYVRKPRRQVFPTLRRQRACTRRLRRLWRAFLLLQDAGAVQRVTGQDCEVMDGLPIPVAPGARSFHPGWLAELARMGTGGKARSFSGVRLRLVISGRGVATGGTLASGNVQERWRAAWLFSGRASRPHLHGPRHPDTHRPLVTPPTDWMSSLPSSGAASQKPVRTDSGCRGAEWLGHGAEAYGVHVVPPPPQAAGAARPGWSSRRQGVETPLAHLTEHCGLKDPGAHTSWGLLMGVAAKGAAEHLGILLNRVFGRPDFAFATLII